MITASNFLDIEYDIIYRKVNNHIRNGERIISLPKDISNCVFNRIIKYLRFLEWQVAIDINDNLILSVPQKYVEIFEVGTSKEFEQKENCGFTK
jgi:hypothetical protein